MTKLPVLGNSSPKVPRRTLLSSVGASLSLWGAGACARAPEEHIVPYVERPSDVIIGRPTIYSTTVERRGYALGVLAHCFAGRPVKLEGHPNHPANQGALGAREQALLHELYDPERARRPKRRNEPSDWDTFYRGTRDHLTTSTRSFAVLLDPTSSLSLGAALSTVKETYPTARFFVDEHRCPDARFQATSETYGAPLEQTYDLFRARRLLCLDHDLFQEHPHGHRLAREFAEVRDTQVQGDRRLMVAEPQLTPTGLWADERVACRSFDIGTLALLLLEQLLERVPSEASKFRSVSSSLQGKGNAELRKWAARVAGDLVAHAGASLVTVGPRQSREVHLVVLALNEILGVDRIERKMQSPLLHRAPDFGHPIDTLESLLHEVEQDQVGTLLVLSNNPAHTLPSHLRFHEALRRVPFSIYSGLYENETAQQCNWFLPRLHPLESFWDARSLDETLSLAQPLVRPLVDGRSAIELLAGLTGRSERGRPLLENLLSDVLPGRHLDHALAQGFASLPKSTHSEWKFDWTTVPGAVERLSERSLPPRLELNFAEDSKVDDGRFANNRILQELPDPITKVVWDNTLILGPRTARKLGLNTADVARVSARGGSVEIPVLVETNHAEDCASVSLGYGRRSSSESNARDVGTDVAPLRSRESPWTTSCSIESAGRRHDLVRTQHEFEDHDRTIALAFSQSELKSDPDRLEVHNEDPVSLLKNRLKGSPQWGMSIDLSRCLGCSACVVACQVENNVPVVGKDQARLGRHMHWLRIDRYEERRGKSVVNVAQPMACQHCEKAPCEYVCPVGATTHSSDGLNEMTYNRCVGTRYCSNNCPYKVRRFNYLSHDDDPTRSRRLEKNPNVSVRSRGVMEKCTYCVQRIRRAQIDAKLQHLSTAEVSVVTACQQACPTRAIDFGSVSNEKSSVSRKQNLPRAYAALNELGAVPRTRYLARVDHPLDGESNR